MNNISSPISINNKNNDPILISDSSGEKELNST